MEFKHLIKTVYRAVTVLTLASIALLLLSFMFSFDAINGYFKDGILPPLFEIAFALGIILSLVSSLAIDKHKIIKTNNSAKGWSIYVILAVALLVLSQIFNRMVLNKNFGIASIGICFFALFVFLCAPKGGYTYSHLKLMFLLLSVIFPITMTMDNNSAIYRHSNSVENMLSATFAIAFLMYILYEGTRLFTGAHSRWHLASMLLTSHIGLSISVPYIIGYVSGDLNEKIRFYQMVLTLIISLFVEIELLRFVSNAESKSKMEWEEIESSTEGSSNLEPTVPDKEETIADNPIEDKTDE